MNNNYINMSGFANSYYGRQEKTCPVCGKTFLPAPEHSYHLENKSKLVCSYSCVRNWEESKKTQSSVRSFGKRVAVRFVETGEEFKTLAECAKHLNVSSTTIYNCIKYGYPYKGIHIERVKK